MTAWGRAVRDAAWITDSLTALNSTNGIALTVGTFQTCDSSNSTRWFWTGIFPSTGCVVGTSAQSSRSTNPMAWRWSS